MNLKHVNAKLILVTVFLLTTFLVCEGTHAYHGSNYILGEGEKDKARLNVQNEIFKKKLIEAFKTASTIKNLKGLTVVDFGCGIGSAYPVIKEFISETGKYTGIDSSENQIITARQKFSEGYYIVGDEKKKEVLQAIASADIIFMRFV